MGDLQWQWNYDRHASMSLMSSSWVNAGSPQESPWALGLNPDNRPCLPCDAWLDPFEGSLESPNDLEWLDNGVLERLSGKSGFPGLLERVPPSSQGLGVGISCRDTNLSGSIDASVEGTNLIQSDRIRCHIKSQGHWARLQVG
jgi:hypothetical protein